MEDGNTPVGGPLVSAEVSSRSGGVPPLRKRRSEERGAPKDAMLEYADVAKMCINEMTVIFKSLDLVSASERVAESVSVRFGDSAVDIGFERGIVADYATVWMNGNVGQQRLHATEQRVSSAGKRPSVNQSCSEQCERSVCCEQREGSASCEQHDGGACCERRGHG